jgi:hypothetical protein
MAQKDVSTGQRPMYPMQWLSEPNLRSSWMLTQFTGRNALPQAALSSTGFRAVERLGCACAVRAAGLYQRARCNRAARRGEYSAQMEKR